MYKPYFLLLKFRFFCSFFKRGTKKALKTVLTKCLNKIQSKLYVLSRSQ